PARLDRHLLLDRGPLDAPIADVEPVSADHALDGAAGVADRPADSAGAVTDDSPGPMAWRLALLVDGLIEPQRAVRLKPPAAAHPHAMATGEDDPHRPLALGPADEERLRSARRR